MTVGQEDNNKSAETQLMASENETLASSNTTAVVVDGRILQEQVMEDLMKVELTDWTISEDGRMILNFELQGSRGLIVRRECPHLLLKEDSV